MNQMAIDIILIILIKNFFQKKYFKKIPLNFLSYFSDRKFGANGFYASPDATDQYEETQGSLVGLNSIINKNNLIIKPKVYWRRNQEIYICKK